MRYETQRRYEDEFIEFHRDKGWFYVTPEESRLAFDALKTQIATEKKQRETIADLFQSSKETH